MEEGGRGQAAGEADPAPSIAFLLEITTGFREGHRALWRHRGDLNPRLTLPAEESSHWAPGPVVSRRGRPMLMRGQLTYLLCDCGQVAEPLQGPVHWQSGPL